MGILKEYKSLKQKEEFFTCERIDSISQLELLFSPNNNESIWRGSNEAKYKIYTSLQRYWIQNDFPNDSELVIKYLRHIISSAKSWNQGFFNRYFLNYNIAAFSNYAILSVLRHHGTPTPLLDFSYNKYIALFFAATNDKGQEGKDEIDSYFSLYELRAGHPYHQYDSKQISYEYCKTIEEDLRQMNPHHADDKDLLKHFYQGYLNNDDLFYKSIDRVPIFKIQDKPADHTFFYIKNN